MKKFLGLTLALLFTALLFLFPDAVSKGAPRGILLCRDTLLPSLLPFMTVSSFLSYSGAAGLLSSLFRPLTGLLRLSPQTGGVWIASLTGSFPSGAQSIAALYELGAMDKDSAERLISCCVCPGPAFMVLAVGRIMLGSLKTGALMLLSQAAAMVILSAIFARSKGGPAKNNETKSLSLCEAFVAAVTASSGALISIFAFVILFAVMIEIISAVSPSLLPLCSLLEVTLGCSDVSRAGGLYGALAAAFLCGFGGFSVCFQVLALSRSKGLYPRRFFTVRLLNGLLCAGIFFMLLRLFPQAASVYNPAGQPPLAVWSADSILGGACFAAMLLLSMLKAEPRRI